MVLEICFDSNQQHSLISSEGSKLISGKNSTKHHFKISKLWLWVQREYRYMLLVVLHHCQQRQGETDQEHRKWWMMWGQVSTTVKNAVIRSSGHDKEIVIEKVISSGRCWCWTGVMHVWVHALRGKSNKTWSHPSDFVADPFLVPGHTGVDTRYALPVLVKTLNSTLDPDWAFFGH